MLKGLLFAPSVGLMLVDGFHEVVGQADLAKDCIVDGLLVLEIKAVELSSEEGQQLVLDGPPQVVEEDGEATSSRSQSLVGVDLLSWQVEGGDGDCRERSSRLEVPLVQVLDEALVALPEADVPVVEGVLEDDVLRLGILLLGGQVVNGQVVVILGFDFLAGMLPPVRVSVAGVMKELLF